MQLYGLIDLGVSHFSNGSAGETKMSTGGESGSRIGVRGREALGGGVQAFFQVETGFCANGSPDKSGYCSGGSFMGRTSQLGLKGPLGTLQMGRMYTLAFHDQVAVDPFHYGTMGDIANIGLAGSYSTVPPRFSQAVEYVTPSSAPGPPPPSIRSAPARSSPPAPRPPEATTCIWATAAAPASPTSTTCGSTSPPAAP